MKNQAKAKRSIVFGIMAAASFSALGSSHREAPGITHSPKLDCTDFYFFMSYEPGRADYVTLIANYIPLQDAYGGPNYFQLDDRAVYEIHLDNNGDAQEDITLQFRFSNTSRGFKLPVGPEGNRRMNSVPVLAAGPITDKDQSVLLVDQTYTLNWISGPRRTGTSVTVKNAKDGSTTFTKPQDNVGTKTFPDYEAYARAYEYEIEVPGSTKKGRLFVGQRKDPFVVNLGETFDLINISTSPVGPTSGNTDSLAYKNVTSMIVELPVEALRTSPEKPILGAWATASKMEGDSLRQQSRLSMPLVNEVVIGLDDKDKFNGSEPKDDLANFADYVTHPTLPAIIELLYGGVGAKAPTAFPRADLVAAFVTGVDGLNKNGAVGEMQRLNTAIPATPRDQQNNLGVIAGIEKGKLDVAKADLAGFPNGRRPGDDVVDIELRVAMGKLLDPAVAPAGDVPFTDGATVNAMQFANRFPYLNAPIAGSPNTLIQLQVGASAKAAGPFAPALAKDVQVDAARNEITVAKPDAAQGFLKVQSDRVVNVQAGPGAAAGNTFKAVVR